MSRACDIDQLKRFAESQQEGEDNERPGRPVTARTQSKVNRYIEKRPNEKVKSGGNADMFFDIKMINVIE